MRHTRIKPFISLLATTAAAVLLAAGVAHAQQGGGDGDGDGDQPPPADERADDKKAPEAKKTGESANAGEANDVAALRKEYLKLRDLLFRSRARAAAVASALFSSKVRVHLDYTTGRFYSVKRATVRLDNATLFDDSDGAITKNKAPRFDGYVAPGRHKVTFRIEAIGKDDDRFSSVVESSVIVLAPAGADLIIKARAKDGGDIPYTWKKKKSGSYQLHLDIDVQSVPRVLPGTGGKSKGQARAR